MPTECFSKLSVLKDRHKRAIFALFCLTLNLIIAIPGQGAELPTLGDRTSAILSPDEEFEIGQVWLRNLRAHTDIAYDPLMNDYLEQLIYRLASHSALTNPKLQVVLLNNKEINAFAVPGGVIGLNTGLLLYAESEDQLASVIAHELAHLSQRHFVRNLEAARETQWTSLAAVLASIAIAATQGAEPGFAAITSTQAFATQSHLQFSRQNEQEADRIGMQTLAAAGMDPYAMPQFFAKIQAASSLPEFLLTHPVTESRIADALHRATQLTVAKHKTDDLDFQLMRAHALVAFNPVRTDNIQYFKAALRNAQNAAHNTAAYRYGLSRAYLQAGQLKEALNTIEFLRQQDPTRIIYILTEAEIDLMNHHYAAAEKLLANALALNPNNYPLTFYYAQSLLNTNKAMQSTPLLEAQIASQPNNLALWKLLADAYGANHNPIGVHQAQAEILFLTNQSDRAIEQLRYALALTGNNYQLAAKIVSRMEDIKREKEQLDF